MPAGRSREGGPAAEPLSSPAMLPSAAQHLAILASYLLLITCVLPALLSACLPACWLAGSRWRWSPLSFLWASSCSATGSR